MQRVGVAVNLQHPEHLSIDAVKAACGSWQRQQLETAQGTKTRHYVDVVLGGVAAVSGPALYLDAVPQRRRRQALAQLRTGSHWLAEETGRWQRQQRQERVCQHCAQLGVEVVEDLSHAVFVCPLTAPLRQQYPQLFQGHQSMQQFFSGDAIQLASFSRRCRELFP